jgi:cytidylate kinase
MAEALTRAGHHGLARHLERAAADTERKPFTAFTVALGRQVGARGTTIARALGKLLNWPVYDRELIERVAREMHIPDDRLKGIDEQPVSKILEFMEAWSAARQVSEDAYVHHMLEVLFALGAHGECVIVGRGAAAVLPAGSTFRVRLVAPRNDRIEVMAQRLGLPHNEAERRMDEIERFREQFSRSHFNKDPADPLNYDLVLNSSRWPVEECAGVIAEGLRRMQAGRRATGQKEA